MNCLSDIKTSFLRPFKLFVFTKSTKSIKAQNANKRISNSFFLDVFCAIFLFLFAVNGFVLVKSDHEKNPNKLP